MPQSVPALLAAALLIGAFLLSNASAWLPPGPDAGASAALADAD